MGIRATNFLVTGASGFIGSHLVDSLVNDGFNVRVLLREESSRRYLPEGVDIASGDIRNPDSLEKAVDGVDVVFHIASLLGPSSLPFSRFYEVNATGTENLLRVCKEKDIKRFIHCSSVGVMGDIKGPPGNEKYQCNPRGSYEKSKLEGERIAIRFASENLPVSIVRPAWVYGPRDRRTLKLFRAIQEGRFLFIGKGGSFQHPVYISDLIDALKKAAEAEVSAGEIFIIGGSEIVTIKRLCGMISGELNVEISRFSVPSWVAICIAGFIKPVFRVIRKEAPLDMGKINFFLMNKAYDIKKAEKLLGFVPKVNLKEGLRKTVQWYRQNGYL